ncbi:hypothetical protein V6N11_044547 [Hibiscus sabdariffa]|uniref:Uncharacterized protein n=2 Tax=Hibiscus sabdariffa TaxID=183260 RepID=A0ABR2A489_9ROSI
MGGSLGPSMEWRSMANTVGGLGPTSGDGLGQSRAKSDGDLGPSMAWRFGGKPGGGVGPSMTWRYRVNIRGDLGSNKAWRFRAKNGITV